VLHQLPDLEQPSEETRLITDDILAALGLGDQHSQPFYALVAAKIPESVIRQKLSEIKQGKTRTCKGVYQRNEVLRYHRAQKAKGVCGLVVQKPPVSD
jgi:hypothetical protein